MTARHYSNSQNLVISLEYSRFLAKNIINFVSLPWKLHNQKCHNVGMFKIPLDSSKWPPISKPISVSMPLSQEICRGKGQLISKADWHSIDSPKNRTDEFDLFAFLLFRANKQIKFIRLFFGRIYSAPICFSVLSDLQ